MCLLCVCVCVCVFMYMWFVRYAYTTHATHTVWRVLCMCGVKLQNIIIAKIGTKNNPQDMLKNTYINPCRNCASNNDRRSISYSIDHSADSPYGRVSAKSFFILTCVTERQLSTVLWPSRLNLLSHPTWRGGGALLGSPT